MNSIEILGQYVSFIRSLIEVNKGAYPVLGAYGSEFFIELASGSLTSREIIMTFLVEFDDIELDSEDNQKAINNNTEIHLKLPDSAHLIALLGLLEKAFNSKTTILHPLNCKGDYFTGWGQAVSTVSEKSF